MAQASKRPESAGPSSEALETSEVRACAWEGTIGLCLSGGGYRAAAFHLGALAYLNHRGLLDRVRALSTVSGGSVVGAAWLLSRVRGEPFEDFLRRFAAELEATDCGALAIDRFAGRPREARRPSLARMLADVYAERFFSAADGEGPDRFRTILEADSSTVPQEIAINATEFDEAYGFRFVRTETDALCGSYNRKLDREQVGDCRVADIVAASCCFPGALEPLVFPEDFVHTGSKKVQDSVTPACLMDGGIYDNQGIAALMDTQKRLGQAGTPLDVVIVSDTDRPPHNVFQPRPWRGGPNWFPLYEWAAVLFGVLVVLALGAAAVVGRLVEHGQAADLLHYVAMVLLVGTTGTVAGAAWLRHRLRQTLSSSLPNLVDPIERALWSLSPRALYHLARARLESVLALTNWVFTARIRRLGYQLVYATADDASAANALARAWRVSNLIYSLRSRHQGDPLVLVRSAERRNENLVQLDFEEPSRELQTTVDAAHDAPTTLWFDVAHAGLCRTLVTAGMAAMCFNLGKHLHQVRKDTGTDHGALLASVRDDWRRLNRGQLGPDL